MPAAWCSSPTSTASARRTGPTRPGTLTGLRSDVTREQLARAAVEGVVAQPARRSGRPGALGPAVPRARWCSSAAGARSAAYRQVVADLTGRPVVVPDADELVARGAAVQAAAVLTGASFADVASAWGSGAGATTEPDPAVDGAAIQAAYAAAAAAAP